MDRQLTLKKSHHDLFWKRKAAIEASFKVKIHPLFMAKNNQDDTNGGKEVCCDTLEGNDSDIAALREYVKEVFVQPEIIEIVSYHHTQEAIFRNPVWIRIIEEVCRVCISVRPDCELNVSGRESSVRSAVVALEDLIAKYSECKDTALVNEGKPLASKLVAALKACKNVNCSIYDFDTIPNDVIKLLLSLLEKTHKDSFPEFDEPESLDDSVMIIDPPEEEKEVSVIILDSDSDSDSTCKRHLESGSSENTMKKKKLCGKPLKKNRSRALQNMNSLQGGSDSRDHLEKPNGHFQCSKMENTVDNSKLPKIENPSFIPLSMDNETDNSLSKITTQHPEQSSGVVEVDSGVEVIEDETPKAPRKLRPIIIDGCNVAFYSTQGRRDDFSWKRIQISLNYFLNRGHDVKVFLPQYRRPLCYEKSGNQDHVEDLETKQLIIFTPSRRIDGRTVSCYDDRFIVDLASRNEGIILSNDNYRDLINENPEFAKTIKERLLMYVFAGDELMIPTDPLGKSGPRLDEFLSFPAE